MHADATGHVMQRPDTNPRKADTAGARRTPSPSGDERTPSEPQLRLDRFPYWVKRLGMDDALVATFAVIDWDKRKLTVAPATVALAGDATAGWTMHVDQGSAVFPFLKSQDAKVYMALSYIASS